MHVGILAGSIILVTIVLVVIVIAFLKHRHIPRVRMKYDGRDKLCTPRICGYVDDRARIIILVSCQFN